MSPKGNIGPPILQTCQEKNFLGKVTEGKCPFQRSIKPMNPWTCSKSFLWPGIQGLGRCACLSILGHLLLFILAKNSGGAGDAIYSLESGLTPSAVFIYISRVYGSLTFLVIKSVQSKILFSNKSVVNSFSFNIWKPIFRRNKILHSHVCIN